MKLSDRTPIEPEDQGEQDGPRPMRYMHRTEHLTKEMPDLDLDRAMHIHRRAPELMLSARRDRIPAAAPRDVTDLHHAPIVHEEQPPMMQRIEEHVRYAPLHERHQPMARIEEYDRYAPLPKYEQRVQPRDEDTLDERLKQIPQRVKPSHGAPLEEIEPAEPETPLDHLRRAMRRDSTDY